MWKKLFGKRPIHVWVIKQIDRERALLHLCGEGSILPDDRRDRDGVITALQRGDYRGPAAMADNGVVLNARLFAPLVPHDGLHLGADGQAHWRGCRIPERAAFRGRRRTRGGSGVRGTLAPRRRRSHTSSRGTAS